MSEATEYYTNRFGKDLIAVSDADPGWKGRISLVAVIPGAVNATPGQAKAFNSLPAKDRVLFLMSYFYSALLDQAIHATLREEYATFDHLAGYPKLVGILGSAYTNIHPANLLVAATIHLNKLTAEAATELFTELTTHMTNEYVHFFTVQYPARTGRLNTRDSQLRALDMVLQEILRATTPPEPHLWESAFTQCDTSPSWSLTDAFIQIGRAKMSDTLCSLRKS